jgi:geranylgeranyl pyrophosphate synthase
MFKNVFEKEISKFFKEDFPRNKFTEPVHYYTTDIPRNMFRSVLPVFMCRMFNKDTKTILPIATTSEIIFSIALLQDDIIDNDHTRQGMQSGWIKYGMPICIASIDYCYYYVWKILKKLEKFPISKKRIKIIYESYLSSQKKLYQSFLFERFNRMNLKLKIDDVLKLHECKTVTGINSIYCSALAMNLPISDCNKFKKYALLLGYAGQIKNDILDFHKLKGYGEYRKFSDFKRGYMNYPLIKLFNRVNKKERSSNKKFRKK